MEEKKTEVIAGIRSCLVSTKGKCDLRQISDDFRILMGYKIPFSEFGFKTLEQFIVSIPSLSTSRVNGQLLVDAKPSEKSSHIASLVNKQKGATSRRRARPPPPRYATRLPFNHQHSVPRWRPKNVQRGWKKTYQSSPRPAAVSHNQFVNVPSTSTSSSTIPMRLVMKTNPPAKEITPRQLSLQEEPISRKVQKKEEIDSDSLASIAKKRITKRMADITITNTNGSLKETLADDMIIPKVINETVDWSDLLLGGPRSAPVLSSIEIQKLEQESLAAVDLQNPVWKWSGSESSPENNKVPYHIRRREANAKIIAMEFTGDHVLDLHAFAVAHKLGSPNIKVIPRKGKVGKGKKPLIFYDCHIKIGNHSFSSYPQDFLDEGSAKQAAAKLGLDELLQIYNRRQSQSLLISDNKDILERIPPLVQSHYSGIWNTQLEEDYAEIYKEQLPVNWLEIVDTIPCITVLPLLDKRFVLRFCKPGEVFQKGSTLITPLFSQVSVPSNTVKFNDENCLFAEITCVASAGEIWCRQIDTPESEAFIEMIMKLEEHYNEGNIQQVDTVEVGGYYVAYQDLIWCRVRVFEINGNNINCFCIDYGDEWILQKSSLFLLKRQFALVQAQAFVCRLSRVEEIYEASKSSSYLSSLISKIVQVQLDSPTEESNKTSPTDPALSVILYDADADIIINQQLISVISIEQATPILDRNSPTEVYVTFAMDDGSVYVQVHSIGYDQLNSMLEMLENNLLENKLELPTEPITPVNSKDRLYFTQYNEDGHWYRSKIIDWAPDKNYAQIFFVDYGNTSVVKLSDQPMYPLDELSDVISQFPEQAVRVRMDLENVPVNFADRIKTVMPPDQPVIVKIIMENSKEGPLVEFFKRSETDNVLFSVNMAFSVESELKIASGDGNNNTGKSQSSKLQRLISLNQFVDGGTTKNVPSSGMLSCPPLPKVGQYFDVKIQCAVNPYNFFIQPYESQDKLTQLMVAMQEKYKDIQYSPLQIEDIQPGKIYASRYQDGVWYRTSVMKVIHHGSISVFYCDFGYYANLNVKQLVPLDPEYMELPYQAIKAKIAGIEPKNLKWSMADCKYFEKLVCKKPFVSILVAKEMDDLYRYDTVLSLKLIDTSSESDVYLDKLLVQEGIAKFIEPHP